MRDFIREMADALLNLSQAQEASLRHESEVAE
jgi:hypothetical protein